MEKDTQQANTNEGKVDVVMLLSDKINFPTDKKNLFLEINTNHLEDLTILNYKASKYVIQKLPGEKAVPLQ